VDERARSWLHGYRSGLTSAWCAVHYIAEAQRLLDLCRVIPADRKLMWQTAEEDTLAEHPGLPPLMRRALSARRITVIIIERLKLSLDEPAYPQQAQAAE
jgi:hypothetical protein